MDILLEIWKDFNKTKIFNKSFIESTRAVMSGLCFNPRFED